MTRETDRKERILADINFTTIGGALSLSPYVADFVAEIERRQIEYNIHALGTNVEISISDLAVLLQWIISYLGDRGETRLVIDVKITTRFDRDQDIDEKIKSVTQRME